MGTFFSEEIEWYKKGQAIFFYESYKNILAACPYDNKFVLTNCAQCNIQLNTSCSNQGRNDIRCEFGCRDIHLRAESNRRVAEYYKTAEGQEKKKALNGKRNLDNEKDNSTSQEPTPTATTSESNFQSFHYIRFILSLFSNQVIQNEDLTKLITQAKCELRQRSLDEIVKKLHFSGYG